MRILFYILNTISNKFNFFFTFFFVALLISTLLKTSVGDHFSLKSTSSKEKIGTLWYYQPFIAVFLWDTQLSTGESGGKRGDLLAKQVLKFLFGLFLFLNSEVHSPIFIFNFIFSVTRNSCPMGFGRCLHTAMSWESAASLPNIVKFLVWYAYWRLFVSDCLRGYGWMD